MKAAILASLATVASASRFVLYFDQYHTTTLPSRAETAGVTHVITAFANSSLFTTSPGGVYTPFKSVADLRTMFDDGTKVCMAIGGWGDTAGFGVGAATDTSRKLFAQNVAATADRLGYDCVDVDWEYPGGNGDDYIIHPNSGKVSEIETFPLLLAEIKAAIGSKELSIAAPGLVRDMIAYTAEQVPKINAAVDFVNVMAYDLMNRRDNATTFHNDLKGCLNTIDTFIARGFTPSKLNLGFAFYAKWFTTQAGVTCSQPKGCPVVPLENPTDGSDNGMSGALTFEASVFAEVPSALTDSPNGSCGAGTTFKCSNSCCSQYGNCGTTDAHCLTGCQFGYGTCKGNDINGSFKKALAQGIDDPTYDGMWWWDPSINIFWTWDNAAIIERKFAQIIVRRGLGGAMAWSLAEDSYQWEHLKAMQSAVKEFLS
ncbi:glycoside hydrolase [Thozetella sp. PMI_491]|nr:glycoside hydrolase [Thozetella sp. PMI_491]